MNDEMKKILILTAVLFCFYNLGVVPLRVLIDDKWFSPASMWQSNVIKTQSFVYDRLDSEVVIVGSSLSNNLNHHYLPASWFNIGLIGYSAYDGLEIIKRSGAKPKAILIETNWLDRGPTPQNTDTLFLPGLYSLRKYLPALRESNRPINILIRPVFLKIAQLYREALKSEVSNPLNPKSSFLSQPSNRSSQILREWNREKIFREALQREIITHSQAQDPKRLSNMAELLKSYVDYFQRHNVRLVFFEMPMDKALYNSIRTNSIRALLRKHFPSESYSYLPSVNWAEFVTADGLHLNGESAIRYTKFINVNLKNYLR